MNYYLTILLPILVVFFGSRLFVNIRLYRLGRYIKLKYPDRYQKQLTSSNPFLTGLIHADWQFPFPFNFGQYRHSAFTQLKKVLDIAEIEKDSLLLVRANRFEKIIGFLWIIVLVLIFAIILFAYWLS